MKKMDFFQFSRYSLRMLSLALFLMLGLTVSAQQSNTLIGPGTNPSAVVTDATTGSLDKQTVLDISSASFATTNQASAALGQAIQDILNAPAEGGSLEGEQALRLGFYQSIAKQIKFGSSVGSAILNSYPDLVSNANDFSGSYDTNAILQSTLTMLD